MKINRIKPIYLLNVIFAIFLINSIVVAEDKVNLPKFKTLDDKVNYYQNLFKKDCLEDKITNNSGDGFDLLYGTRNMKTILYGIAYRGGANNFYHKTDKRDNRNPLPGDGLQHLCDYGFTESIYLYSKNFDSANITYYNSDSTNILHYQKNTLNDTSNLRKVVNLVKERIDYPELGPIYLHCWNGWHQSGYISAVILMQFCSYSNQKALEYWIANTDGNHKGYENVKNRILDFEPFKDIKISKEIQEKICPCMNTKSE
jgi:hypothetical protein